MHSMLKKSLLAITVAAATAGVQAQTIEFTRSVVNPGTGNTVNPTRISAQGLAIEEAVTIGTDVTAVFVLQNDAAGNSTVAIDITGGVVDTDSDAVLTSDDAAVGVLSFQGFQTEDGVTTALFTSTVELVADSELTLTNVVLEDVDSAIMVAGRTLLPSGFTTNQTAVTTIATVNSQFAIGSGDGNRPFNNVIDVADMRASFISGFGTDGPGGLNNRPDEGPTVDNFFVSINNGLTDVFNTDINQTTIAVTGGDFDFLNTVNDDDEVVLDSDRFLFTSTAGLDTADGESAPSLEGNTLTGILVGDTNGGPAANPYVGLAVILQDEDEDDRAQLTAQSFSADITVRYDLGGTNGTLPTQTVNAGAWTLSGATVNIPFMPFNGNTAQLIRISNDGGVTGEIELTAFDNEGNVFGPVILSAQAEAGSVTNLAPAVREALEAEGFDGSGELDLTFVVNSPAEDIEVVANYRNLSANDRVSVIVINP